jgi:hypothetical protein
VAEDELQEVIGTLRRKRADHFASIERIDAAIQALLDLEPASSNGSNGAAAALVPTATLSVRKKVIRLANEADVAWNAAGVVAEYERRHDPVQGVNPMAAARTAIAEAFRAGELVRVGHGIYKATKYLHPAAASNGASSENSGWVTAHPDVKGGLPG